MTDDTLATSPTAVYIQERLDYDPETGVFLWRYCDDMPRRWNTRYAGTVAGVDVGNGYRRIGIGGKMHGAHRLAWLIVTGEWPDAEIDHINGDRSDNRIANLREVSCTENGRNKAMPKNNTSGVIGVGWDSGAGKWRAAIGVAGRNIFLGLFTDIASAIAARKAAEIAYGFHPNHGR
jgi:hypothetical protein